MTHTTTSKAYFVALTAVLAGVSPAAAQSERPQQSVEEQVRQAEKYAAAAYEAYQGGEPAEAVSLYRRAYDVVASAAMLYNMARIYDARLLDRPLAITFYRRYVADPGAVADLIRTANQRLLELKAAEAAALEPRTPALFAPAKGSEAAVEAGVDGEWSPWRLGSVIAGLVGVAGVAVGTGYGLSALSESDTVDEYCDGNACRAQRGVDAANSATDKAFVATLGFAVGGALVATSAALFFLAPKGALEWESLSGVEWSPIATASELGFGVTGSF